MRFLLFESICPLPHIGNSVLIVQDIQKHTRLKFQVLNRVLYLWQAEAPKIGAWEYFFFLECIKNSLWSSKKLNIFKLHGSSYEHESFVPISDFSPPVSAHSNKTNCNSDVSYHPANVYIERPIVLALQLSHKIQDKTSSENWVNKILVSLEYSCKSESLILPLVKNVIK